MKLWLLELLACPIDHAFPLDLSIFHWENENSGEDAIEKLLEVYSTGTVISDPADSPLQLQENEDSLLIRDNLILQFQPLGQYLSSLISKIDELSSVHDQSDWKGQDALNLVQTTIKDQLQEGIDMIQSDSDTNSIESVKKVVDQLRPALEFLNCFKYQLEIEDGVMRCSQCQRWFPIFETIPQMLPDDLRNTDQDAEFQNKWHEKYEF